MTPNPLLYIFIFLEQQFRKIYLAYTDFLLYEILGSFVLSETEQLFGGNVNHGLRHAADVQSLIRQCLRRVWEPAFHWRARHRNTTPLNVCGHLSDVPGRFQQDRKWTVNIVSALWKLSRVKYDYHPSRFSDKTADIIETNDVLISNNKSQLYSCTTTNTAMFVC